MNTSRFQSQDILLPDEHERRQIFYWLKRISSYTAWNRIRGFYQAWAKIAEDSVREASERGWVKRFGADGEAIGGIPYAPTGGTRTLFRGTSIPESDYVFILKGLAHCDEGLRRLRQGDKRIFKYDANGEFVMAARPINYWHSVLGGRGEIAIDYEYTPHWDAFLHAFNQLIDAWRECGPDVIESERLDAPAHTIYGVWLQEHLPKMHFPAGLPTVPDPTENVFVRTGKTIPYSGIWEPVDVPKPGLTLFRSPPPAKGPFPIVGCMNYLHGGSDAPIAKQETENDSLRAHTTWRLLWRDDRYEDGTIPAEEGDYVFLQPEVSVAAPVLSPSGEAILWAESGQATPKSGRWLVESDLQASIDIQAGEILPQHNGRHVRWVLAES